MKNKEYLMTIFHVNLMKISERQKEKKWDIIFLSSLIFLLITFECFPGSHVQLLSCPATLGFRQDQLGASSCQTLYFKITKNTDENSISCSPIKFIHNHLFFFFFIDFDCLIIILDVQISKPDCVCISEEIL